jgi:tRNA A-37 threonylcarbamoyl transferase component Bud32/cytochrome c-type biogenesis protein CcmH/NrfG
VSAGAPSQGADSLIGQRLGGCEIQRRLGQGGMATVYVARQVSMDRDVALKVMRRDLVDSDPRFYERFEREAKVTATLAHAHILPVIDFGQTDGLVFLVMRLMPGTLQDYIARNNRIAVQEIARLLDQIASGLDYAHEHDVIHRDLKPGNVLLDRQNNCYLADFGIAYVPNASLSLTAEGEILGTPHYMAPEMIQGDAATKASDIYALGIVLYELLCGHVPFRGETTYAILHQHLQAEPEPVMNHRDDLPPGCQDTVMKALAKRPDQRYRTAGDLARAFSAAVGMTEGASSAQSPGSQFSHDISTGATPILTVLFSSRWKSVRRRFSRPAGVILAALVLMAAITAGVLLVHDSADSAMTAAAYNEAGLNALAVLDYSEAIQNFDEAIRLDPGNAAAHYNRGVAYEELGDFEVARAAYETALEHDAQLLMGRYRLAELLLDAGEVEEGFRIVDAGVRILQQGKIDLEDTDRDHVAYLLLTTRGRAYLLRGGESDLSLAESDLSQALLLQDSVPYPASVHYYLALAYEAQGRTDAALQAWYEMLATYDSDSPHQREWAAQAREAIAGAEAASD